MSPHLYTVDQVAERLNLHAKTVRRYIRDGRLKAKRIGKEYRVARSDLDEFAGAGRSAARRADAPGDRVEHCRRRRDQP